ncbi:MAG: hypothetical protein WC352_03505 [Candidatus Omnitrophota bacterium]|jgi:hypothetical protein
MNQKLLQQSSTRFMDRSGRALQYKNLFSPSDVLDILTAPNEFSGLRCRSISDRAAGQIIPQRELDPRFHRLAGPLRRDSNRCVPRAACLKSRGWSPEK